MRTHLNRMLKRIEQNMGNLQNVITETYFQHTLYDTRLEHRR